MRILRLLLLAAAVLSTAIPLSLAVTYYLLPLNLASDSIPKGLYRWSGAAFKRGDYVLLCYPYRPALFGKARGYHPPGLCPARTLRLIKRVAATPGDRVTPTRDGLLINGSLVPGSRALDQDSAGRPLPQLAAKPRIVGGGEVWVYSDHDPRSWDSRYFGPIPIAGVRTRVLPVYLYD